MPAHSLLGASGAYRWLACPGSFRLSQSAPHRPSSIYAATGTLAHDFIERAARAGTYRCDETELGQTKRCDSHDIEVDQTLIDGVNVMLEYLEDRVMLADWSGVEFRVDLADYFKSPPPVPVFGWVDAAALGLYSETLEVIDYKNGAGVVVTPTENPQMMFYGAGVLARMPPGERLRVHNLKLTIVQPNAGGGQIRSWETSVLDLLMWVDEVLVPGVEACVQPDAPLNPGTWCRFCPVAHACPKLMADAIEMAKREFDDISPDAMTDASELAQALESAERATLWITRLQEFALDQLQRQVRIPGWGLVPTRPTRKWLDTDSTIAGVLDAMSVEHDTVWETRVRSPAQMEKALCRTRRGRAIWNEISQTMVEARSTGVKLGRTGIPDAREDFDDDL